MKIVMNKDGHAYPYISTDNNVVCRRLQGGRYMGINPVILICIGICVMILMWVLFQELFIKLLSRVVIGAIIIYSINEVLPQYAIGINAMTIGCSGVLGIPGVVMVYILGGIV